MNHNAAVHPPPAAAPGRAAESAPPRDSAPGNTAIPDAPERTVWREIHRMFALIAVR